MNINCSVVTVVCAAAMAITVASSSGARAAEMNGLAAAKAISASIPSGGSGALGVTYVLGNQAALQGNLGLAATMTSKRNGDSSAGVSLEANYIKFLEIGRVSPFVKGGVLLAKTKGKELGDGGFLAGVQGLAGVEIFFTDAFSIAGATGIQVLFQPGLDDAGKPANFQKVELNTLTSVFSAQLYWQ